MLINEELITTDRIDFLCRNNINVYALRTDKIHPVVSGNKWFKLKFYLKEALAQNANAIVTFGGAYSNHIVATAFACRQYGLECIGVIRGEEPKVYSQTLKDAVNYGMQLHFVSRQDYKEKKLPQHLNKFGHYFIPEGGYGPLGAAGMATLHYDKSKFHTICCAIGSGTMMAGLINSKKESAEAFGISVLKNNHSLKHQVWQLLLNKREPVNIFHDYHFGGYAKFDADLIHFMNLLYDQAGVPTDFVYSAKLFYAVHVLTEKNIFPATSNVLIIHCGGLQGNRSLPKGTLIF